MEVIKNYEPVESITKTEQLLLNRIQKWQEELNTPVAQERAKKLEKRLSYDPRNHLEHDFPVVIVGGL